MSQTTLEGKKTEAFLCAAGKHWGSVQEWERSFHLCSVTCPYETCDYQREHAKVKK